MKFLKSSAGILSALFLSSFINTASAAQYTYAADLYHAAGVDSFSVTFDSVANSVIAFSGLEIDYWDGDSDPFYLDAALVPTSGHADWSLVFSDSDGNGGYHVYATYNVASNAYILSGNDGEWNTSYTEVSIPASNVPEPEMISMFAVGLLGLGLARKKAIQA